MESDRERPLTTAAPSRRARVWYPFGVYPNAVLLGGQLLGIVVYPFTDTQVGASIFSIFQLLVLVLAAAAVRPTPALSWVSMGIGVPAVVLTLLTMIDGDNAGISLASNLTHAMFYAYLAYALLRYMFADQHVTTDEVFATGSCFTVIAWAFAYLYGAVQDAWGAGQFAHAGEGALDWMQMLFLSFTTMTGTGLSDISPAGAHARSIVMLEQMAGMFYVGLVVARILAMMMARFGGKRGDG